MVERTEENGEDDNVMQEVGVSRFWHYLRQNARQAATPLWTLAVTILCTAAVTGIAEENDPKWWIASLSVVVLLLAAAFVACRLDFQEVNQGSQVTSEDLPL